MIGRLIFYSGRVQGVGFRQTAAQIAQHHPVTGCVRNLPDGRVQLVAEGEQRDVEAFLQEIRDRWRGYIESEQAEDQAATGKYKRFDILVSR